MSIAIARATWGAGHGQGGVIPGRLGLVVVHHTASPDLPPDATQEQEAAAIRGIEAHHASPPPRGNGWAGIGYSFLVCPSGRAYEGRGWRREGAHTAGQNRTAYGLCFVQDGETRGLSAESVRTARAILLEGVSGGHLADGFRLAGHRDFAATACPGKLIYARLEDLRPLSSGFREAEIRDALAIIEDQVERIRGAL